MIVVVKIGTSSLTDETGAIQEASIIKLCDEVAVVRRAGHEVIIVTSAAISAGLPALGFVGTRPKDILTLQAAAAVGQSRLLRSYDAALAAHDIVGGQILVSPANFFERRQYLHARQTLQRLLQLGVVPIVNENDAVADDEIRFGDNDRISALVAHAVRSDLLVLLTDMAGLYTADPRVDAGATLVDDVYEVDQELERAAGGAGSKRGSGGMASKLAAARMAAWSGVRTVIAASTRADVVIDAVDGRAGVGTVIHPQTRRLSARKLWIAFAMSAAGRIDVDDGAYQALVKGGGSLLRPGVAKVHGAFGAESGVEIATADGAVFAKGVTRYSSTELGSGADGPAPIAPSSPEVIHRDDLVLLI